MSKSGVVVLAAHEEPLVRDAELLIREYAASLPFALDFQNFEDEVGSLPGDYRPPGGALLVARVDGRSIGCVGLRPLDLETAELKRLWVRAHARGTGAGRLLVRGAVDAARAAGYRAVRLDTTPGMEAAQALYRSLGFVEIASYRPNPVDGATFHELRLG